MEVTVRLWETWGAVGAPGEVWDTHGTVEHPGDYGAVWSLRELWEIYGDLGAVGHPGDWDTQGTGTFRGLRDTQRTGETPRGLGDTQGTVPTRELHSLADKDMRACSGRQPIMQTIMAGKMEMVLPAMYMMNRFMGICFSGARATSQQRCNDRGPGRVCGPGIWQNPGAGPLATRARGWGGPAWPGQGRDLGAKTTPTGSRGAGNPRDNRPRGT